MKVKVYALFFGSYEDRFLHGVYATEAEALAVDALKRKCEGDACRHYSCEHSGGADIDEEELDISQATWWKERVAIECAAKEWAKSFGHEDDAAIAAEDKLFELVCK